MFLVDLVELVHEGGWRSCVEQLVLLLDFEVLESEGVLSEAHCLQILNRTSVETTPLCNAHLTSSL